MKTLGIYIHVPFCVQKCAYCDFVSFPVGRDCKSPGSQNAGQIALYFDALCGEIEKDSDYGLLVDSVFFGGGTPSVVPARYIETVLCKLKEKYNFSQDCEISMEINPGTVDIMSLREYREMGINRISIGAQSLCDRELRTLGRIHTAEEFVTAFHSARAAGFDNISVDLMSALPMQTAEDFRRSLSEVLALCPEHLSVYSLILEEGTKLYDMREKLSFPEEDTVDEIDRLTWEMTNAAGYRRYEISNFSKEGRECRHNMRYWRREYYRGYGLAASSMLPAADLSAKKWSDIRFSSEITMEEYLEGYGKPLSRRRGAVEFKTVTKEEAMEEFFFLGLRTVDGVKLADFRDRFDENADERFGKVIRKYTDLSLMETDENGWLKFTEKGMQVSSTVLADFLL